MQKRKTGGGQAGVTNSLVLTSQKLEGFEGLFEDWRLSGQNAEVLELGGSGDLQELARRCLLWASVP